MLVFPNIKINLGLYITEKRQDQYHNILTAFYPVSLQDVLEIVPAETFEFVQTGLEVPGKQEDNLCVKAYHLLKTKHSIPPVRLHLHKIVPMGAGVGGGSSDAAFTLSTLNELFQLNLSTTQLEEYAAQIGSDCAFFIQNRPVVASGRGNEMENVELDLKGQHLVLAFPSIHVSTAEAYGGVKPQPFEGDFKDLLTDKKRWKAELKNQFEASVFQTHPALAALKQRMYDAGAWYAAMSGSGSSVFGIFDSKKEDVRLPCHFFHIPL